MKGTQFLSRRERDLNTPKQFFRSIGVSAVAHAVFILGIILISEWGYKPRIIVPGYKVNLVTLESATPRSLLKTPKPEKKEPKLKKKAHKQVKKKKLTVTRKKKISKAKKIVPKKKQIPSPEKKKVAAPKPEKEKKEGITTPQKTIVTEGIPFPYIWYLKIIERKVRDNWITHGIDTTDKITDPVVRFRIGRDGLILEKSLERSSGSDVLDSSALSAVINAQPFPPLPHDYSRDSLGVHFGFTYEQNE